MLYLLKQKPQVWRVFSIFIASVGTLLLVILLLVKSGIADRYHEILPDDMAYYMTALAESWNIVSIISGIFIIFLIYDIYKSKRYLTYNNRYIYSVVALFFGIQLMLDASTLPIILNAKSMKPFADKVIAEVPEGKIYSYVSTPMLHFFIINFYTQDRVVEFEREAPREGYLLVGEHDFNYIREKYGEEYTFTPTLRSDRKGNDVKDFVLLLDFQKRESDED